MNSKNDKIYINNKLKLHATLGYFAQQADGSVWLKRNGTIVLATATIEKSTNFPGFLPLSVDYREVYSATGKIPGGYFKREGKPTDREVLIGRIIDRTIRPLFPEDYFDKICVIITAYSIDKQSLPTEVALIAASIALSTAKNIPFMGPVGCSESLKVNDSWLFSPSHDDFMKSKTRMIFAGDYNGINMLEGYSEGIDETELRSIFEQSHEIIKEQITWQQDIISDYLNINYDHKNVLQFTDELIRIKSLEYYNNDELKIADKIKNWAYKANIFLTRDKINDFIFIKDKKDRTNFRKKLENIFLDLYKATIEEEKIDTSIVLYAFDMTLKHILMDEIAEKKKRVDGRAHDTIRPIECIAGILPCAHGSGIFMRGRTQVLTTATLGSEDDVLKLDTVIEEPILPLMLHYNFLPFSVGEAKALKGPGRREIGHGFLAQNAIKAILPDYTKFPYSIRLVADVIECDGSSSMATVCSGILALLDAGVPIKKIISGIAMGIILDHKNKFHILTDIAGIEDELGLMDLKITGDDLITAIQMDIKHKSGLPKEFLIEIFEVAKKARRSIIEKIKEVISTPKELSKHVPRCVIINIPKEKIGAVIGSGGKVIKQITEKTGTDINIEDSGNIKVFGIPGENFDKAIFWIKIIAGQITPGDICDGIIKKVVDFGLFVEVAPHCDGLVHISTFSKKEQEDLKKVFQEGAQVKVNIVDYDADSNRIRLKIIK